MTWARRFADGLSPLRDRAAARLAGPRINPSREGRTLRLFNYGISRVRNDGRHISLYGWTHRLPVEGDYLILDDQKGGTTRYRAVDVRYPCNPNDMFFAECEFAPR